MITNSKKSHYLAVTNLSALLKGIWSNHKEDFYCLNCFNSYTSKNKLKELEQIFNYNDSCHIDMPSCAEKTLNHNPRENSLKEPFAIYIDLECILKKVQKQSWKILCRKKRYTWTFWLVNVYKMLIW